MMGKSSGKRHKDAFAQYRMGNVNLVLRMGQMSMGKP